MHYIYRATTDKLPAHLDSIAESGDTVLSVHFTGGRDWVLICRKGTPEDPAAPERIAAAVAEGVMAHFASRPAARQSRRD